jgi:cobalt transporter subunit CbtB
MVNFENSMPAARAVNTDARIDALAVRWPALGVLALGLVVLYCIGFLNLPQAHNTTHDARHAAGFPCH